MTGVAVNLSIFSVLVCVEFAAGKQVLVTESPFSLCLVQTTSMLLQSVGLCGLYMTRLQSPIALKVIKESD